MISKYYTYSATPFERQSPIERPLENVNLNINVLIFTPGERPPLLNGHISDAKGVASQEGFNCIIFVGDSSNLFLKNSFQSSICWMNKNNISNIQNLIIRFPDSY